MPRDRSPDDESADKPSGRRPSKPPSSGGKGRLLNEEQGRSLMNQIVGLTTQFTSGAMDLAKSGKYNPLAIGDKWVKYAYRKNLDPARLQAMTEAGHLLRDAREVAGINVADLAEALGLTDSELLEDVEKGVATLPFDMILRIASLIARHDPVPFVIKFLRTYNPDLEQLLQQWGISTLPMQYERERRFVNIYRRHDQLRKLSDSEYDHFIDYINSATDLTLNLMSRKPAPDKQTAPKKDRDPGESKGGDRKR